MEVRHIVKLGQKINKIAEQCKGLEVLEESVNTAIRTQSSFDKTYNFNDVISKMRLVDDRRTNVLILEIAKTLSDRVEEELKDINMHEIIDDTEEEN